MFTIKHYEETGSYSTYECDTYRVKNHQLSLFKHGLVAAIHQLAIDPGQVIYIENNQGKTIDTIRKV